MSIIKERINPMGLRYILTSEGDKTIIRLGTKSITVNMSLEEVSQCWYSWQMQGAYMQDAFSKLSAEEREFLMTGITPAEWNNIFAEKEE